MARFIELHDLNNNGNPVLINVDWIASVSISSDHTVVLIGVKCDRNGNGSSWLYSLYVEESYYEIKDIVI